MQNFQDLLKKALSENSIDIVPATQDRLIQYLQLLQTWNKVYNLTSITHPKEMVYLHLVDSLAVAPYLTGTQMLDVGTGAGLPGIPLAITHPQQHWTLLDKNSKKTRFLTQAIAELGLKNAIASHTRSEEFHPGQGFDNILSRAFGTIRMFAETAGHLLNPNGVLIAMKGKYPQDELNDLPEGFQIQDVTRLDIKGTDIERHIVRIKKS